MTPMVEPPEIRPAATVVILRDRPAGMQVLLTRRPETMRFMAGLTVFPGGGVAPADRDGRWADISVLDWDRAAALIPDLDPEEALATLVCALREAYEEVGFTFGELAGVARSSADEPATFLDSCIEKGIALRTDLLTPAGRWVTPHGFPLRFDTRFFIAEAPEGWAPEPDSHEVESCWWSTPEEALGDLREGRLVMAPPTIGTLQRLSRHRSVAEVTGGNDFEAVDEAIVMAQRVSDDVTVVLAPNPSLMTGPGTNTYVIGRDRSIVIDVAMDDESYLEAIVAAAGPVEQILVTHRHPDHVGGIAALVARTGAAVRAFGDDPAGDAPVDVPIADRDRIDPWGLVALHTPGHATDHLCFFRPETGEMFSGDNVLGQGTAVIAPPEGDMASYLESLRLMRSVTPSRIYPGHFNPVDDALGILDGYLRHREEREAKILEAVSAGAGTLEEVVEIAYRDTPVDLHPVAQGSALAHLQKLSFEGTVVEQRGRWITRDP